jgi:hypothetical protein
MLLACKNMTLVGVQEHGTCCACFWGAKTWHMLGCKDMLHVVHVVGVQGHGTCWGARTWYVLGCKDMIRFGVQGHGTCCACCWSVRTWHMLGCKDMVRVAGVQGKDTCWGCMNMAHVGMQCCVVHSRKPCACI